MEDLIPYKEELALILSRGYIKGNQDLLKIAFKVHRELYPKDIIQENCGACAYRVIGRIGRDFERWDKIQQAKEIQKSTGHASKKKG